MNATLAPKKEQDLLRQMLAERGFEVGLQVAEVCYSSRGRRHLMISEDMIMSEEDTKVFAKEFEARLQKIQ